MDLGLMFFSSKSDNSNEKYELLLQATRFADEHDFCCVWTPERHFNEFGGIFPNPSVISAGLATITKKVQLRAGSLISPLHNPIRIAEEWAVVDNLSNGRVALSFGSGWNVNDFLFFPERYPNRHSVMYEQIELVQKLWRGESLMQQNTYGKDVEVCIHPTPLQPSLPIWVTSSGNQETFTSAGTIGANVLTHLITQDLQALEENICRYREARKANQHPPAKGKVSLMLHTFVGESHENVIAKVKEPLRNYLRTAVLLENRAAAGGGSISGGLKAPAQEFDDEMMEELLDITFERYVQNSSLIGTVDSCWQMVQKLSKIGVDEIACLIDFGTETEDVMDSLVYLNKLRIQCQP